MYNIERENLTIWALLLRRPIWAITIHKSGPFFRILPTTWARDWSPLSFPHKSEDAKEAAAAAEKEERERSPDRRPPPAAATMSSMLSAFSQWFVNPRRNPLARLHMQAISSRLRKYGRVCCLAWIWVSRFGGVGGFLDLEI